MRKQLYLAISKKLKKENAEVKHISLWNQDTEMLTQQPGYATPAVFIEYEPIIWEQRQGGARVADVRIWLHIIVATKAAPVYGGKFQDKALDLLDLIENVSESVTGLSGKCFNAFMLVESDTDHNYKEVQHHKECFTTCLTKKANKKTVVSTKMLPVEE